MPAILGRTLARVNVPTAAAVSDGIVGPADQPSRHSGDDEEGAGRPYEEGRPWLVAGTIIGVLGGFVMSDAAGVVAIAVGGACVAASVGCRAIGVTVSMLAAGVLAALGIWAGWWWVIAAVVLVPTLIHVFAMTAMFVVAGAMRARNATEWVVVACLALCSASFVLVPCVDLAGGMMFERASETFGRVFAVLGVRDLDAANSLLGFTAFAYAYHYLNWFLKARTIGWATMTTERKVLLGAVWGVIACAYVIDVRLGLLVSLPLSFGHVLLEMPLNVSVGKRLFGAMLRMPSRVGNAVVRL